jgi:hypothetical protein
MSECTVIEDLMVTNVAFLPEYNVSINPTVKEARHYYVFKDPVILTTVKNNVFRSPVIKTRVDYTIFYDPINTLN